MTEQQPRPQEKWESLAERRIREAQLAGEFDNLPGFGQPIPGIDEPLAEDWWLKDKLRREEISGLPPILQARRDRERTLASLAELRDERVVRRRLQELNDRIRKAHYALQAGPAEGVLPVDIEAEVARWRAAQS